MRDPKGFTLIELLIVVAIIAIIAAIAIPGLLRARIAANEASAIGSMRAVNSAQLNYSATCAHGYAADLLELSKAPNPGGQGFISPDLGATNPVVKSGYSMTYTEGVVVPGALGSCTAPNSGGPAPVTSYTLTADPVAFTSSGSRNFGTSELQTIYYIEGAASTTVAFNASGQSTNGQALK